MKVKLLKRIRARFKIVGKGQDSDLLDLKSKRVLNPFLDWHLGVRDNLKRHIFRTVLGDKQYDRMKNHHAYRRWNNQQTVRFNKLLNNT
jgi:hypothetical protein